MKTFISRKAGLTKIQDLGVAVKFEDTFTVDNDSAQTSNDLRKAIAAEWIEEVTGEPQVEDIEAEEADAEELGEEKDPVADVQKRLAASGRDVKIKEKERRVQIGVMKRLKEYKETNPGIIDASLPLVQQIKIYEDKLEGKLTEKTTVGKKMAEAFAEEAEEAEVEPAEDTADDMEASDDVESAELNLDEDESDLEIELDEDEEDDEPVEKVVSVKKLKNKKKKTRKFKENVAARRTLPSEWESMHYKERIKYLKTHAEDIEMHELESIIDQNSPAVSAVARSVLMNRKVAESKKAAGE